MLSHDYCENYGHPTICRCYRRDNGESCHYCNNNCKFQMVFRYFICLTCKKHWKVTVDKQTKKRWMSHTIRPPNIQSRCAGCSQPGTQVSHVLRVPKSNNIKDWKLLEKILNICVFVNYPKNSIGWHWYEGGGIGCTLHFPDHVRRQFWVPNRDYEYDEWLRSFRQPLKSGVE